MANKNNSGGLPEWVGSGWLLAGFTLISVFLLALTYEGTRDQIAAQEKRILEEQLTQLLPVGSFDNDPTTDILEIPTDKKTIYRARKQDQPVAALIKTTAPDGYNGSILLLVGIRVDGSLLGVRAIFHKETPGLGDEIDLRKSDWILGFKNHSLSNPEPDQWKVKKDGGIFDAFTGATITPRAVVRETKDTLIYFRQHKAELFK